MKNTKLKSTSSIKFKRNQFTIQIRKKKKRQYFRSNRKTLINQRLVQIEDFKATSSILSKIFLFFTIKIKFLTLMYNIIGFL